MHIVFPDITKDGQSISFAIFKDMVERLESVLQQMGYNPDDVCKILAEDNDSNKIEDGENEHVSQVRIYVREPLSMGNIDIW